MIGYNKLDATNEQIQNSFINQGTKKGKTLNNSHEQVDKNDI